MDGKNIMGLMMLAATCGSQIVVTAEGDDANLALQEVEALFLDRFGESE